MNRNLAGQPATQLPRSGRWLDDDLEAFSLRGNTNRRTSQPAVRAGESPAPDTVAAGGGGAGPGTRSRLDVRKTYKLYIGGAFPRSESGRSYPVATPGGALLAPGRSGKNFLAERNVVRAPGMVGLASPRLGGCD